MQENTLTSSPSAIQSPAPSPKLTIVNGHPSTTSVDVAKYFEKNHSVVVRAIESILPELPVKSPDNNFVACEIERPNPLPGRAPLKQKFYTMTRDGFTLLAMGFTGKKAIKFKLDYIEAFNAMEATLREQAAATPALPPPTITPAEQNQLQQAIRARFEGRANLAYAWSRFNNHFQLGSYKQLPSCKVAEALDYIARMPQPGQQPPAVQQPERVTEPGLYILMFSDNALGISKPLTVQLDTEERVWFRVRDLGRILDYTQPTHGPLSLLTHHHATRKVTVIVDNKYTRETTFVAKDGLEWILTRTTSGEAFDLSAWLCSKVAPLFGLRFDKLESKYHGGQRHHLQLPDSNATKQLSLPVPAGALVPADTRPIPERVTGGRFIAGIDHRTGRLQLTEIEPDAFIATCDRLPGMINDLYDPNDVQQLKELINAAAAKLARRAAPGQQGLIQSK